MSFFFEVDIRVKIGLNNENNGAPLISISIMQWFGFQGGSKNTKSDQDVCVVNSLKKLDFFS